jgi:hypothetical protein
MPYGELILSTIRASPSLPFQLEISVRFSSLSLLIRFWSCHFVYEILKEKIENTNGVIRIRKSKDRQQKKMDKQRSTKHPHKTKDREAVKT